MPERTYDWGLAADTGQCRVCASSAGQRYFWPEVYARSGQALKRCGYCAMAYLAPGFNEAGLARFYSGPYRRLFPAEVPWRSTARFFAWRGDADVARQRLSLIAANLPAQGQLFEMGSGFGAFLGQAAQQRPDLQLSASEPDTAQRETLLGKASVHFVASLTSLPEQSLDGVVAFHVLEHLIDPVGFLELAARALRNGGRLWVEVPDLMSAWQTRLFVHPAHLSYFCADSLQRLAEAAGLEVLYCGTHPLASLPGTLWLEAQRPQVLVTQPVAPAPEQVVVAVDQWILRVGWGSRDRFKALLKTVAVKLLGPGLVGEWQRWRQHRRHRRAQVSR
jgi:SAM-dependent methyltransferase